MDTADLSFTIGEAVGIGFIISILIKFSIDYIKKLFVYIGKKYNKWQNISDEAWTTLWMIVALVMGVGLAVGLRINAEETIAAVMPGISLPVQGIWAQIAAGVMLARSSNILNDIKKPFSVLIKKDKPNASVPVAPEQPTTIEKEPDSVSKPDVKSPFDIPRIDPVTGESMADLYAQYKKQQESIPLTEDETVILEKLNESVVSPVPIEEDQTNNSVGILLVEWSPSLQDKGKYYQPVQPDYVFINNKLVKL